MGRCAVDDLIGEPAEVLRGTTGATTVRGGGPRVRGRAAAGRRAPAGPGRSAARHDALLWPAPGQEAASTGIESIHVAPTSGAQDRPRSASATRCARPPPGRARGCAASGISSPPARPRRNGARRQRSARRPHQRGRPARSGGESRTAAAAAASAEGDGLEAAGRCSRRRRPSTSQYLQLQERMQRESREFTALSNVMKVKHDSAQGGHLQHPLSPPPIASTPAPTARRRPSAARPAPRAARRSRRARALSARSRPAPRRRRRAVARAGARRRGARAPSSSAGAARRGARRGAPRPDLHRPGACSASRRRRIASRRRSTSPPGSSSTGPRR